MLEKIKILLGISDTSKDELITVLIEQAIDEAINFTNNNDINELKTAVQAMVVYNYNRLGTEGLNSETFSGNNYSYSADYPESILRQLRAQRVLRTF